MKSITSFFFLLGIFFSAHAQQNILALQNENKQIIDGEKNAFLAASARGFTNASSENFDINFYRCEWHVDPAVRAIAGKVTSYFTIVSATDNIIYDLSDTLTVDSVIYHGNALIFQRTGNDGLQLKFPSILNTSQKDSVSIYYNGVPRSNPASQSFNMSAHNGVPAIYTLSEPYGAKEWWPCKNGLTDKADSIEIIITSPAAYRGTTNGILMNEGISGGNKIVHFKHRYPIATYLVGIAVSNYVMDVDSVQIGDKMLPVIMNAYPEYENDFKGPTYYAKQSLLKFSELFGEYPFIKEHYSQTQCGIGGGGMEHQTNSFIAGIGNQLVAHELGHHWFGDNVTCGSWQHIWLNEGFANYMQFIYVQNFDTSLINAHLQYYLNLVTSEPGGSVFVTDTTRSDRIFDNRLTYAKGGYVVHMLRGVLGDTLFFKGLRQYLNDPVVKNKFATTADLERNLEQVSGKNLGTFFQKWIYGQGYPNYNCTWTQNTNNWIKVQMNQTTSDPSVSFYDMPVQLKFKNNNRDTIITVNNQQNGEIFWLHLGFQAESMSIDPNYWILAKDRIVQKIPAQSTLQNDIRIYPNPAPDQLTVSLLNPTSTKLFIRLYTALGQVVYTMQKELMGQDELIHVPTSQLANGIYILTIYGDKGLRATKIIKK